jgi:hypothetical protein
MLEPLPEREGMGTIHIDGARHKVIRTGACIDEAAGYLAEDEGDHAIARAEEQIAAMPNKDTILGYPVIFSDRMPILGGAGTLELIDPVPLLVAAMLLRTAEKD